jgi:hypothetical protein
MGNVKVAGAGKKGLGVGEHGTLRRKVAWVAVVIF